MSIYRFVFFRHFPSPGQLETKGRLNVSCRTEEDHQEELNKLPQIQSI